MNVIISNKYTSMLSNLEIDVIKKLEGEFEADDIVEQFKNFFFQRMIIDITAIKDYKKIQTLQRLSISLDMDKVIFLLEDTEETNNNLFLSKLISMGIYNFTKNLEGVMYLYNNPNSYRDVAHIQQLDIETQVNTNQTLQAQQHVKQVDRTSDSVIIDNSVTENIVEHKAYIMGIKNVTKQSGSTTFTYMLRNQLQQNYSVVAVEVEKTDFKYFNDKSLSTVKDFEIKDFVIKNNDKDIIIIDVNDSEQAKDLCDEVYYLIEPSVIKLNKLMFLDNTGSSLKYLKDKKVILNQSLLTPKDVLDFEYESGIKVFYNMPPLDEREKSIHILNKFLTMIGFGKQADSDVQEKKNKILGLF